MTQVLALCLEVFRGLTDLLTEQCKGISENVWVKVRQPGSSEGIFEYGADRGSIIPMFPTQPGSFKMARRANRHTGCREERIIIVL